jgi:hypothetical protein
MTWTSAWSNPMMPLTLQRGYGTGVDWQTCYNDMDNCNAVCFSDRNDCFIDFGLCANSLCNTIINEIERTTCNSEHTSIYNNWREGIEYFNVWSNAQMASGCRRRLQEKNQMNLRGQR